MGISDLCTPAFIYVIVSFIALIIKSISSFNVIFVIVYVFFIMLWAWFLNYLCASGYSVISWILVLLPLFTMF